MLKWIAGTIAAILVFVALWAAFAFTSPLFTALNNTVDYATQKVDDRTNYDTIKQVEDTCRSMQASYKSDVLTYEQYKDADGEKGNWAEQAKMRANRTAASYNEYILKNSFVWDGNIPDDIAQSLQYLE